MTTPTIEDHILRRENIRRTFLLAVQTELERLRGIMSRMRHLAQAQASQPEFRAAETAFTDTTYKNAGRLFEAAERELDTEALQAFGALQAFEGPSPAPSREEPIPALLWCPSCHERHVDPELVEPESALASKGLVLGTTAQRKALQARLLDDSETLRVGDQVLTLVSLKADRQEPERNLWGSIGTILKVWSFPVPGLHVKHHDDGSEAHYLPGEVTHHMQLLGGMTRLARAKPHHTHACQHCGLVWRPAIAPTVGVQFLPGFKGKAEAEAPPAPVAPADARPLIVLNDVSTPPAAEEGIEVVDRLIHKLWTKAVGSSDYVKAEWRDLSNLVWKLDPDRHTPRDGARSSDPLRSTPQQEEYCVRNGHHACHADRAVARQCLISYREGVSHGLKDAAQACDGLGPDFAALGQKLRRLASAVPRWPWAGTPGIPREAPARAATWATCECSPTRKTEIALQSNASKAGRHHERSCPLWYDAEEMRGVTSFDRGVARVAGLEDEGLGCEWGHAKALMEGLPVDALCPSPGSATRFVHDDLERPVRVCDVHNGKGTALGFWSQDLDRARAPFFLICTNLTATDEQMPAPTLWLKAFVENADAWKKADGIEEITWTKKESAARFTRLEADAAWSLLTSAGWDVCLVEPGES